MEEVKKRKQVIFQVNQSLHNQIKALAAKRNISMSLWLHRAVLERIIKEKAEYNNEE